MMRLNIVRNPNYKNNTLIFSDKELDSGQAEGISGAGSGVAIRY